MAKQETTCDDILKELRAKQYRPVYYLMGEESYYIDLISDYIVDNVLTDTEKEFNRYILLKIRKWGYGQNFRIIAVRRWIWLRCKVNGIIKVAVFGLMIGR